MLAFSLALLQITYAYPDPGGEWDAFQRFVVTPQQSMDLGWSVAFLGDLNGDGKDEYLVGAKREEVLGVPIAGSIYVVDGATASVLAEAHGTLPAAQLGWAVCRVDDTNGDQISEYATISRGAPLGLPAVHVFDGATGGLLYEINKPLDSRTYPTDLTAVGDWNADNVPDYAVSDDWRTVNGGTQTGTVYIYSGQDGSLLQQLDGWGPGHSFGTGITGGGDADGDGIEDLLVWSRYGLGDSVHVIAGGSGQEIYRLGNRTGNGYFGSSRGFLEDVDGDGCDEILVGAGYSGAYGHGEAYMFSGRTGAILHTWAAETDYQSEYGDAVCAAGDLDRDGIEDVAISAPASLQPNYIARIYIHSGADGHLLHTITKGPASSLGRAMAGRGDVNGDGRPDLLAGDIAEDFPGIPDSGAVYVFGFDPYLLASTPSVSAAAGGVVTFTLDFPATEAGREYRLLASSDVLPDPLGIGKQWIRVYDVRIPLVETPWTYLSWNRPPTWLAGAHGVLDAQGVATATLTLAPGQAAAMLGKRLRFAAVTLAGGGRVGLSSAAAHLTVLP